MYNYRIDFPRIVRLAMKKKDYNQKQLADFVGKTPGLICDWLHDRKKPTAEDFCYLLYHCDLVEEVFPGYKKGNEQPKMHEFASDLASRVASQVALVTAKFYENNK